MTKSFSLWSSDTCSMFLCSLTAECVFQTERGQLESPAGGGFYSLLLRNPPSCSQIWTYGFKVSFLLTEQFYVAISGTSDSSWSGVGHRSGFYFCSSQHGRHKPRRGWPLRTCCSGWRPAGSPSDMQAVDCTNWRMQTVPDIQHEDTIKMTPFPTLSLRLRTKNKATLKVGLVWY